MPVLLALVFLFYGTPARCADTFSIAYEQGRVVKSYPEGSRPVVGLALSGGGARGIAHLGVIQVLEENGIPIDRIAGTSMGSIVGGLYAAGYSTETLTTILETTDWSDYFSNIPERRDIYVAEKETVRWPLFDLRFEGLRARLPSSLSSGQRIISILTRLTAGASYESGGDFDRLVIPFRAVTTDLSPPGSMVVLGEGNIARAIQASSTIPLLFTPVSWEGRYLVDGGLTNNLPVDVARDMGSDFVIAVAIDESMHPLEDLDNALNVADQSTSIMMRQTTNRLRPLADFFINPNMESFSSSDFSPVGEMILVGRESARAALPQLRKQLLDAEAACREGVVTDIVVSPFGEGPAVRLALATFFAPGEPVSCARIVAGLEYLWEQGQYFSITATLDDNGVLTIELTESPDTVQIGFTSGGERMGEDRILNLFSRIPRDSFADVAAEVDSLVREFREAGHPLASISDVFFDRDAGNLRITVDSPVITNIDIVETIRSRASLITREYQIAAGDEFSLEGLMDTIGNLYGTNLFELVYADIERTSGGVGIGLHIIERRSSVVRLGIRYDETNLSEARVTVAQENILGFGSELMLLGHTGKRKKLILLQNQNDRIYKTYYTFNLKTYQLTRIRPLYENHVNVNDYRVDRYGSVISLGQQMGTLGNALFEFRTETVWVKYPKELNRKNEKKELRSIVVRSVIDNLDQYPFPYDGYINTIYIESARKFLGGNEQFVKMYWGGSYVASYIHKHTFIGRFALGTADATTPEIDSFTLGGNPTRLNCQNLDSGRSLYYSDFPGLESEERYGNYLAVGSVAYRLFVPRYFYLTATYSVGNVWDNDEAITADTLLQGYGVTASFETFIGALTAGWGITSQGDDRLHLAAGWEF